MTKLPLIHRDRPAVIVWLVLCLALVAAMVMVGGYTRLSGSGLSITEWKPIHGVIPPLNAAEWQEEFDAYRATPQYEKINKGMSVEEFKTIFWPEFFHRLLGRLVGVVVLIPLLVFMLRRSISRPLTLRLLGIFALGGLQGALGWYMVKSGLIDDPKVSPFRLAAHLSLAFAIFGLLLWNLLAILTPDTSPRRYDRLYLAWFSLLCLQIVLGALVAGSHAGLLYNTWPDMNGQFLPPEILEPQPFLENPGLIQFLHRTLAVLVAVLFLLWWYLHRGHVKNNCLGKVCLCVAAVMAFQFLLGVMTLLHQVPLALALAHQAGGLFLFAAAIVLLRRV
jgi:heme a synthase